MRLPDCFLRIILFTIIVVSAFSCDKPPLGAYRCTANCKAYSFSGRMFNAINNHGFLNKLFTLQMSFNVGSGGFCILCPQPINIYTGVTGSNGSFSFTVFVDTIRYTDYDLKLIIADEPNYIT